MYGSGVVVGMKKITIRAVQEIIHRDLPVALAVLCVVVAGTPSTTSAGLLIHTTSTAIQKTATTVTGFVS